MLDESALRRAEFVEGETIVLGDGQGWEFPKPVLELYPVPGPDGRLRFEGLRRSFGPDYDRKIDAFAESDAGESLNALLDLAVDLLGRNYDLEPEDYAAILSWRPNDEANEEMWRSITAVAMGRDAPKAGAVGSG